MAKLQNTKQYDLEERTYKKQYDLEERTYKFAKKSRDFVNKLHKNIPNHEYSKQLIKSSGSVAANYIEANESLSKKDFIHRIKICRKKSKESKLWLKLSDTKTYKELIKKQRELIQEAEELKKIFCSIVNKSK